MLWCSEAKGNRDMWLGGGGFSAVKKTPWGRPKSKENFPRNDITLQERNYLVPRRQKDRSKNPNNLDPGELELSF